MDIIYQVYLNTYIKEIIYFWNSNRVWINIRYFIGRKKIYIRYFRWIHVQIMQNYSHCWCEGLIGRRFVSNFVNAVWRSSLNPRPNSLKRKKRKYSLIVIHSPSFLIYCLFMKKKIVLARWDCGWKFFTLGVGHFGGFRYAKVLH